MAHIRLISHSASPSCKAQVSEDGVVDSDAGSHCCAHSDCFPVLPLCSSRPVGVNRLLQYQQSLSALASEADVSDASKRRPQQGRALLQHRRASLGAMEAAVCQLSYNVLKATSVRADFMHTSIQRQSAVMHPQQITQLFHWQASLNAFTAVSIEYLVHALVSAVCEALLSAVGMAHSPGLPSCSPGDPEQ